MAADECNNDPGFGSDGVDAPPYPAMQGKVLGTVNDFPCLMPETTNEVRATWIPSPHDNMFKKEKKRRKEGEGDLCDLRWGRGRGMWRGVCRI